jgi:hypothetical protein
MGIDQSHLERPDTRISGDNTIRKAHHDDPKQPPFPRRRRKKFIWERNILPETLIKPYVDAKVDCLASTRTYDAKEDQYRGCHPHHRLELLAPHVHLVKECIQRVNEARNRIVEEVASRQDLIDVRNGGLPTYDYAKYSKALERSEYYEKFFKQMIEKFELVEQKAASTHSPPDDFARESLLLAENFAWSRRVY